MTTTIKIVISLIPEDLADVEIFLTIDNTLQAKLGEKFECYSKLFDHTKKTGSSYLNGRCFVSLVINIPLWNNKNIKYLSIPVGYKLYNKKTSKLEIASNIIDTIIPLLDKYNVILLCDSWYTKGAVLTTVKKYDHLNLIGAVRSDIAIFDLPPSPTGKRGRPRKKDARLDYKSFSYTKVDKYYISTKEVITWLFDEAIYITVTTTDIEAFASVRIYISTKDAENLNVFSYKEFEDYKYSSK